VVTDYEVSHVANHNDRPSQWEIDHLNMLPVTIVDTDDSFLNHQNNGKGGPVCARKAHSRSVGLTPPILNLDKRRRKEVNVNSRPIYPRKGTLVPINWILCWSVCLFGHFGIKEISCLSRIPNPDHPACSVLSIRTKLFLLPYQSTSWNFGFRSHKWSVVVTDPSCLQYSSTGDVVHCYLRVEFD
jgi:hypothetical protein